MDLDAQNILMKILMNKLNKQDKKHICKAIYDIGLVSESLSILGDSLDSHFFLKIHNTLIDACHSIADVNDIDLEKLNDYIDKEQPKNNIPKKIIH